MAQPPSSNEPNHLQEAFENAKRRMANTVTGQNADDIAFFAEENARPSSSNDPSHIKEMFDKARRL